MNKVVVSIIVTLLAFGLGKVLIHPEAKSERVDLPMQIEMDFDGNKEAFTLVETYCFEHPDIASKGITSANSNNKEVDEALELIFNKLDYTLVQLGNGTVEERSYVSFIKNSNSQQEEYSLIYSIEKIEDNSKEIAPYWYVRSIFFT